ncbi:PREDICTED: heterochromatin-associated protein MENT-like [Lepidothrix coronata]|uniref:Leukocyte elastase inhibitor n=1 Tax=Lepidothrix coronata TaxID=321398 RepID=A0A6J0IC04_9PASS|nr:PREDICTED: heterochromatin-associated protein MENT-like [Lepidothrix coronata]
MVDTAHKNKTKKIYTGVPVRELIFNRHPKGYSEWTFYRVQTDLNPSLSQDFRCINGVSVSTNSFTLDLYKKLNENSKGQNIFFSPWSIATALAMVHLGAKGDTAVQTAEVLHFNQTAREEGSSETRRSPGRPKKDDPEHERAENIHSGFRKLLPVNNKRRSTYLLKSANRLYEEKTYPLLPKFLQLITSYYNAKSQAVNFKTAAEQVRAQISSWVENKTERKIQSLLPAGSLHSRTVLFLVNAIYFKGKWEKKFLEKNTSEMPFRLNKNETKPVQMMFKKDRFNMTYIGDLQTKILELPYVGNELSMIILLPDAIQDGSTGLERLERELTYEKLIDWISPEMMYSTEVRVSLPRFKLEEDYNLNPILSSMGMPDAFDLGKADFSGMSSGNELVLSKVVHKSFVEVNEEGTEAAAATAAVMMFPTSVRIIPDFTADHPFLFFIRHNKSSSILFCGRFCSP